MSLALLCSQRFALGVSEMLGVIADTPTPQTKGDRWLTNSPHLQGPGLLPQVPLSWTPGKGMLTSTVQCKSVEMKDQEMGE